MNWPVKLTRLLINLSLGLVLFLVGSAEADIISILPPTLGVEPFGEQDIGSGGTLAEYYAQEFVLPVSGFAKELSFFMRPRSGPDGTDFHLLLTETSGTGASLRATSVLFESPPLTLSPNAPQDAFTQFTVDLGHTLLNANTTYLWMIDAFVTADGIEGTSTIGAAPVRSSGFHFLGTYAFGFPNPGDRATHFSGPGWNDPTRYNLSLSYSLTYDVVPATSTYDTAPEPSTLLLFGSGLAGLGARAWRRRYPKK